MYINRKITTITFLIELELISQKNFLINYSRKKNDDPCKICDVSYKNLLRANTRLARQHLNKAHYLRWQENVRRVDPCYQNENDRKVKQAHLERLEHVQGRVKQVLHVEPSDVVGEFIVVDC